MQVNAARVGDRSSCGASIVTGLDWSPLKVPRLPLTAVKLHVAAISYRLSTETTGSPIAGTQITASPASSAAGDTFCHQDTSLPALSFTENNKKPVYEYLAEEAEVTMNQPAYLLVEGVDINGGYSFRSNIIIRGSSLHVSSQGWAPSAQSPGSGSAVLNMRAELWDGDQLIDNSGINAWPDGPRYTPIGHTTIQLPEPQPGKILSLHLQGTFIYQTSSGSVNPIPPSTSKMTSIQAVEK